MKKILFILSIISMLVFSISAYAADESIYTNEQGAKANETAIELEGWGKEISDTCFYDADVKFGGEGAGFTLVNKDGTKGGTSIRAVMRNDVLTLAADGGTGSYFIYYIELDTETWYHIKLIGSYGVEDALVDMVVDVYDENMNVVDTKNYYVILMNEMYASSGNAPEHIRVEANTEVKNVSVTRLVPDELRISAPSSKIPAGTGVDLNVKAYRQGSAIKCAVNPVYSINAVDGVSISPEGRLEVAPDAPVGEKIIVTVQSNGIKSSVELEIISDKALEINSAAVDSETGNLTAVDITKNFYADSTSVLVVTAYDNNGILIDSDVKPFNAEVLASGEMTEIPLDYTLPEGYSQENCTIKVSAWSLGNTRAPSISGTVAVRALFEENNGAVEWDGEFRSIIAVAGNIVYVMQIDNCDLYVNGAKQILETAPYIEGDRTYLVR